MQSLCFLELTSSLLLKLIWAVTWALSVAAPRCKVPELKMPQQRSYDTCLLMLGSIFFQQLTALKLLLRQSEDYLNNKRDYIIQIIVINGDWSFMPLCASSHSNWVSALVKTNYRVVAEARASLHYVMYHRHRSSQCRSTVQPYHPSCTL